MTFSTQENCAASSFCKPSTRAIRVTCQRQQKPVGAILTVPPSTPAKITSPVRDLNRSAFFAMIALICVDVLSVHNSSDLYHEIK